MKLEEIGKKKFLGKGQIAKCYTLEDGNVLKIFNHSRKLYEMDRFKYFMQYSNDSFVFPFEFIYDSKKFYGYITKRAPGITLEKAFSTSNLLNLSTHSFKLERNIDFISSGKIVLYDFHDENVLYDGKKYSVIDPDENGIGIDSIKSKETNQLMHRLLIGNLFLKNLDNIGHTKLIRDNINKYKYMSMRPSEMIVQIKDDMEKYYKESIETVEDVRNIIRR